MGISSVLGRLNKNITDGSYLVTAWPFFFPEESEYGHWLFQYWLLNKTYFWKGGSGKEAGWRASFGRKNNGGLDPGQLTEPVSFKNKNI